jgi:Flp pilus assembly protein TadD
MTARPSLLLLALLAAALAGCATQRPPMSRSQAAAEKECRERADAVFEIRNPGDKYRTDQYVSGQRDSPFGGSVQADPTADLQARYRHDQILNDCLRRVRAQPNTP